MLIGIRTVAEFQDPQPSIIILENKRESVHHSIERKSSTPTTTLSRATLKVASRKIPLHFLANRRILRFYLVILGLFLFRATFPESLWQLYISNSLWVLLELFK
ncbi:hypothetical protein K1719_033004 [Acacia pycnantha]|nr:hypothetical protein K1719_033004 [Acacia pycnantha]